MKLPTIIQKPCIRKCLSFEGEQQKIEHNGSRRKFSAAYISMIWPEEKLMTYDFYDEMDSTTTINHLDNLQLHLVKNDWKRLILIWDNASYHVSKIMLDYINAQRDWLTDRNPPTKESTLSESK